LGGYNSDTSDERRRTNGFASRAGNFSVGRLMEFLTALGQDVKITVKPTRKAVGEMEVVIS
jgi:hypothetical protein